MAQFKAHKFVSALPGTLEADSVYYVRTGTGFDHYVTNSTGEIVAYPLNLPSGGGSSYDPTNPNNSSLIFDEFVFSGTTTGTVGELGWFFVQGSVAPLNGAVFGRPGLIRRTSGTTANTAGYLSASSNTSAHLIHPDDVEEMTFIIKINAVASDFTMRVGLLQNATTANLPIGCYFEKLSTDTNWFGTCTNSGPSQTRQDTGQAMNTNWVKLKIRRAATNDWRFSINDGAEVAVTSNAPSSTGVNVTIQIIPTTTTARSYDIDFFSMKTRAVAR